MKETLLALIGQLKSIQGLYVAENWGQLNLEQPPVNFPCALVDVDNILYSNTGGGQLGEATIMISVADMLYGSVDAYTPALLAEKVLKIFDLIHEINIVAYGMRKEDISPLVRIKLEKIVREDSVREFTLFYKFGFTDCSMKPKFQPLHNKPCEIKFT